MSLCSLREEKAYECNELSTEPDKLTAQRNALRNECDQHMRLDHKLTSERDRLEADIKELKDQDYSEQPDLHKEANWMLNRRTPAERIFN